MLTHPALPFPFKGAHPHLLCVGRTLLVFYDQQNELISSTFDSLWTRVHWGGVTAPSQWTFRCVGSAILATFYPVWVVSSAPSRVTTLGWYSQVLTQFPQLGRYLVTQGSTRELQSLSPGRIADGIAQLSSHTLATCMPVRNSSSFH